MATHDYNIANQSFPATRSDINNALAAIQSSNSAATAPSGTGSTVAGELFYNTTDNKLQIATDANGTFVDVALDSSGDLAVTGALDVTGVATFTAEAVFNGGFALGDSDKITLGAGDDLEIYHDGSNSFINDAGTGTLQLQVGGTTKLEVTSTGISLDDNVKALFGTGDDLEIYHDGSNSYISDTGTGDLYVSAASAIFTNTSASARVRLLSANTAYGRLEFGDTDNSSIGKIEYSHPDNYFDYKVNDSVRFRMEGDGDFHSDGDVIAYSTTVSDERLKTGIHTIQDALDKVYSLKGVEFTYKTDGRRSAGLIAQDVEKVLPSAVSEKELPLKVDDGNEYKVLQYDQTIGLLVEAVKELKDLVDEQAQEIELLKKG